MDNIEVNVFLSGRRPEKFIKKTLNVTHFRVIEKTLKVIFFFLWKSAE